MQKELQIAILFTLTEYSPTEGPDMRPSYSPAECQKKIQRRDALRCVSIIRKMPGQIYAPGGKSK